MSKSPSVFYICEKCDPEYCGHDEERLRMVGDEQMCEECYGSAELDDLPPEVKDENGDLRPWTDLPRITTIDDLAHKINDVCRASHAATSDSGWWEGTDIHGDRHVVPAKLCLIHSEISEAMEGHRKGLMDDKLPHRPMIEVELADAILRITDLAAALGLDLGGAVVEKMAYNAHRHDHKREVRAMAGGKAY